MSAEYLSRIYIDIIKPQTSDLPTFQNGGWFMLAETTLITIVVGCFEIWILNGERNNFVSLNSKVQHVLQKLFQSNNFPYELLLWINQKHIEIWVKFYIETILQWELLNVITDNVIYQFMWSNLSRTASPKILFVTNKCI
jgi:hypothetical protein